MSVKPETRYYRRVHKYLPPEIHIEKMSNMYRGGTADHWISGNKGDLWIEYKWLPSIPRLPVTPNLSALQKKWLRGRWEEGRNVVVIVGCPAGGVVMDGGPGEWEGQTPAEWFVEYCKPAKEIAAWIEEQVHGPKSAVGNRKGADIRVSNNHNVITDRSTRRRDPARAATARGS